MAFILVGVTITTMVMEIIGTMYLEELHFLGRQIKFVHVASLSKMFSLAENEIRGAFCNEHALRNVAARRRICSLVWPSLWR